MPRRSATRASRDPLGRRQRDEPERLEQAMTAYGKTNHPNIKLVTTVYGNDDDQTSFDKTEALLQTYPNLKGIISPTTVGIAAAARYLRLEEVQGQAHRPRHPNQMREVRQGRHRPAFALWNPEDLGYLAAYAAKAHDRRHDHRQAGRQVHGLGLSSDEYTVGADGTVRSATRSCSTSPTSTSSTSDPVLGRRDLLVAGRAGSASVLNSRSARPSTSTRRHRPSGPACFGRSRRRRRNYSLFLDEDGLLIGYYETDDLAGRRRPRAPSHATGRRDGPLLRALDGRPTRAPPAPRNLQPRRPVGRCSAPARQDTHDHFDRHHDRLASRPSSCPPGRSATPAPASRCSARRCAARPEEKIADAAQVHRAHRARADASRCTSRGTRSTTSPRSARYAEDLGVALGTINSNTFQDDDYKFGSLAHRDPEVRRKAIDHHLALHRHHERDRLARPQDLARRRHELPRPGRHPRAAGPPGRLARRDLRRASATTSAWCSSTSSSSRRSITPTSPTGAPATRRWPPSATRRSSASTPATTRPARTSSSSSCSCCASASSAPSTSTRASTPTTT